jgi:o-succinylbenzoate synthase
MRIIDIQCYPYRLPFRSRFSTAHSELAVREGAIVEIRTADGISGIGEIAPLPEFAGGNLADALAALSTLAARLQGQTPAAALYYVYASIAASSIPTSTACGLESALLDLLGKASGQNVGMLLRTLGRDPIDRVRNLLPDRPTLIPLNAVVGAATIEAAVTRAREVVRAGFECVKLKMGNGEWTVGTEIERVAAIREAIGPDVHLRLDANEAWSFAQASAILAACVQYAIQYVEQPLQASNLAGMRALRQAVSIPIAADEAVHSLASARRVLAEEAADVLVVKPQLAGGLSVGWQIIQEAAQHGVSCVVTSTIESGVGVVGALYLAAASPEVTLECGLATLPLLEDDLLLDDLTIHDGFMTVPAGPGLGVRLDRAALEKYAFS